MKSFPHFSDGWRGFFLPMGCLFPREYGCYFLRTFFVEEDEREGARMLLGREDELGRLTDRVGIFRCEGDAGDLETEEDLPTRL